MKDLKEIIAYNITNLRKSKKMTQLEFSKEINYSDKAISKWERAESLPDIVVLKQISDLFGVTVDYLLDNNKTNTDDTDLFNLKGDVRFLKKVKDSDMIKIPVLGAIRAGLPLYADENIIDYEYIKVEPYWNVNSVTTIVRLVSII